MDKKNVKENIRRAMQDGRIDVSAVTDSTDIIHGGIIDSMGIINLISNLEKSFGITFEESDINETSFRNIDSIATMISKKISLE
jgi:acyl carrier protein